MYDLFIWLYNVLILSTHFYFDKIKQLIYTHEKHTADFYQNFNKQFSESESEAIDLTKQKQKQKPNQINHIPELTVVEISQIRPNQLQTNSNANSSLDISVLQQSASNQLDESKSEPDIVNKISHVDSKSKSLIDTIRAFENQEDNESDHDHSTIFRNINVASILDSRKHSLMDLKIIAINPNENLSDRENAIRHMQKIPHLKLNEHLQTCLKSILDDTNLTLEQKYLFFANNEKFIKLNYDLTHYGHKYMWDNWNVLTLNNKNNQPLIVDNEETQHFRLKSASYLLCQYPSSLELLSEVQQELCEKATNKSYSNNIRSICADLLFNHSHSQKFKQIGAQTIEMLGMEGSKTKSLYDNSQNAHNIKIVKSTENALLKLSKNYVAKRHIGDLFDTILETSQSTQHRFTQEQIEDIRCNFVNLLTDTTRYASFFIVDVILMVDAQIQQFKPQTQTELYKRMCEEIVEMKGICSSGLVTRLINILSGFYQSDDQQHPILQIDFESQLYSNIIARLNHSLKQQPEENQTQIFDEMTDEDSDKDYLLEFVEHHGPISDLEIEFVESSLIPKQQFDSIYEKAICDYCGIVQAPVIRFWDDKDKATQTGGEQSQKTAIQI